MLTLLSGSPERRAYANVAQQARETWGRPVGRWFESSRWHTRAVVQICKRWQRASSEGQSAIERIRKNAQKMGLQKAPAQICFRPAHEPGGGTSHHESPGNIVG